MIILGIDPGSRHTGYGVIQVEGRSCRAVEHGVLDLAVLEDHADRLRAIYDGVTQIVQRCLPEVCAVEMPVYGQNPQSMLKLGRAQAAAMLAALNAGITVAQYTPKTIKQSVTGNGNATKEQVRYMICALLDIPDTAPPLRYDASDALSIAICHSHRIHAPRYTDWAAYVQAHPERL